jgi:hypothetical protein
MHQQTNLVLMLQDAFYFLSAKLQNINYNLTQNYYFPIPTSNYS